MKPAGRQFISGYCSRSAEAHVFLSLHQPVDLSAAARRKFRSGFPMAEAPRATVELSGSYTQLHPHDRSPGYKPVPGLLSSFGLQPSAVCIRLCGSSCSENGQKKPPLGWHSGSENETFQLGNADARAGVLLPCHRRWVSGAEDGDPCQYPRAKDEGVQHRSNHLSGYRRHDQRPVNRPLTEPI